MMRLQQMLFISFSLLILAAPALAAEEIVADVELEGASQKKVEVSAELESGGKWQSTELGGLNHNLIMGLGWEPFSSWRVGLDSEAILTSSAGEPGGLLDTELTLARTGLSLGAYGDLSVGSLTVLPTYLAERTAGLQLAQGAVLTWSRAISEQLALEAEVKGTRWFRDPARAAAVIESTESGELLAAAANDRWRLEEKLTLGWEPLRSLGFEASAKHTSGWKWFGGREDLLTLEQRVSYAIDAGWSLGIGHRNETKLVAQDGTRRRVALFRPDESKLFGTLAWEL